MPPEPPVDRSGDRTWLRAAGRVVYWLVVVAISLALLVGLVLFVEGRDESQVGEDAGAKVGRR